MATARLDRIVHHLRKSVAPPGEADQQLLARFVEQRDEAAFVALVTRHGPLVMGVCRRLLGHEQDAEDAFQATFLVLARKANRVRWSGTAGPWLYEVATRTALEARSVNARRRARETLMHEVPHAEVAPVEMQDWRAVLDEELNRLPEKYRAALVLCELEGRSRKEAAELLGVPAGTLSSRLDRARKLLAQRLARRGLSGCVVGALAGEAVPATLVDSTVRAAMLVAAGLEVTAAAAAVALMKGVLRTMFLAKLRLVVAVVLVVAMLGVGGFAYQVERPAQAQAQTDKRPTEMDVLRKEVELLRLRLQVVEAEVRDLKGQARRDKALRDSKLTMIEQHRKELTRLFHGTTLQCAQCHSSLHTGAGSGPSAPKAVHWWLDDKRAEKKAAGDATREVEAALKALREARDDRARRSAAEALEKAAAKLREQLKASGPAGRPRR
jgi:RNA polymerase sigma factor (sigma-70 family)